MADETNPVSSEPVVGHPAASDQAAGRSGKGGEPPGRRQGVGICVSGGGVRAASFGLGALQALQDERQLVYGSRPAEYLAAVSGGSYIAGAITMLGNTYADDEVPLGGDDDPRRYPFAPDTPEVEYMRRHARYLVGGGVVETVLQFAGRLALNLVFVAAAIYLIARPAGWLYGWGLGDLSAADTLSPSGVDVGPVAWLTAVGVVVTGLAAVVLLATTFWRQLFDNPRLRGAGTWLLGVGAVALLLGVVVPEWLGWVADHWVTDEQTVESVPETGPSWTLWSVVAAVAAGVTNLRTMVTEGVGGTAVARGARRLLLPLVRALAALVAAVAVPVAIVAFATMMAVAGALNVPWDGGVNRGELVLAGVALLVLVLLAALRDPAIWSLHPFYKRRLMSCFCVRRDPGDPLGVSERPYRVKYLLSQSRSDRLPMLMVCAAANVSGFGTAPAGHNVLPFVFSPDEVGFTSVDGVRFATEELEEAVAGTSAARNLTLPASIAISGSAVSPSMGKMTIAPVRTLFALLNLRLGVWLPNPGCATVRADVAAARIPRAPAPWYLLKEAFGWNRVNDRLVYVSDGGHYENLGLVELLRKGCREVWCIDAAGDKPGQTNTLTEAMLLAESELGVRWDDTDQLGQLALDPEAPADRGALPTVIRTHAVVTYWLKDDDPDAPAPGRVVIVRLGLTAGSPRHLADYQRRRPTFPYDSTGNQLFRAERFDAYRSLGYASMQAAITHVDAADSPPAPELTVQGMDLPPSPPGDDAVPGAAEDTRTLL